MAVHYDTGVVRVQCATHYGEVSFQLDSSNEENLKGDRVLFENEYYDTVDMSTSCSRIRGECRLEYHSIVAQVLGKQELKICYVLLSPGQSRHTMLNSHALIQATDAELRYINWNNPTLQSFYNEDAFCHSKTHLK